MTPKFCGLKFKNGGDMVMGAKKTENHHFRKKTQIFCSKNMSDFRGKHMHPKRLFLRKKKIWGWGWHNPPPKKNLMRFLNGHSKKTHFHKNNFGGESLP